MGPYKGRPRAEFGGRHRKGLDSFAEKKNGSNLCGGVGERGEREGKGGRQKRKPKKVPRKLVGKAAGFFWKTCRRWLQSV